jgi:exopolysaccharide biosynthesis protein
MNREGTYQHQGSKGTWADANPAWSPDGTMIAFERCCLDGHSGIYVMPSTGGSVSRITPDGIEASHPTWSPDGTKLAFVGYPSGGGSRNLYTIGTDGTGMSQLTNDSHSDLSPSWDPVTPSPVVRAADVLTATVNGLPGLHAAPPARPAPAHPKPHRKHHKKKPKPFTKKTTTVAPGLTLTRIVDRRIPQRIFVLRAKVQTTPLTMDVSLADNQLPGFETVQSMAGRHRAIAAVNGDFGLSTGRPINIYAEDGNLVQTMFGWGNNFSVSADETKEFLAHPVQGVTATVASTGESWPVARVNEGTRPVFGQITEYTRAGGSLLRPPDDTCQARLTPSAQPRYDTTGKAVVRDYVVEQAGCFAAGLPAGGGSVVLAANAADQESLMLRALQPGQTVSLAWTLGWHRVLDTIGGFPMLVRDGRIVVQSCSLSFCGLNPRTGVGYTADGTVLMVVVDGRRAKYSIGMTLTGFAREMQKLGAVTAMNFDGGGSSTMVVRGKVVNHPSDPGGPRHVSSALLVLNGPDRGEPGSLHPTARLGAPRFPESTAPIAGMFRSAWRIAARDPGSTGGLVDALASRAFGVSGFRLAPALIRILRLYRAG